MGQKSSKNYILQLNEILGKRPLPKTEKGQQDRWFQGVLLNYILDNPVTGLEVYMRGAYGDYDIDQGTLLSALRNAICYLVTLAGKSSGNSSDELIQLKQYLNECKTKYADIESQNRDLNAEIDTLRSVIADYKSRIQKAEEKIQELTGKNQNLANEKSAWVDKMKEKDRTISDLTEHGFRLTREVDVLEKDNAVLESKQKELLDYQAAEKELLPFLQKTAYYRRHKGKSIGLEPSQIDSVIRLHLKDNTNYRIHKDLGFSKTTIRKIIEADYHTSESLEKILSSLHRVNVHGNWAGDKQERLNSLIRKYEFALRQAKAQDAEIIRNVRAEIKDLGDYLEYTKVEKSVSADRRPSQDN